MADDSITVTISQQPDGHTFNAMIECPAFVDAQTEFPDVGDAMLWASDRIEREDDPFTYNGP